MRGFGGIHTENKDVLAAIRQLLISSRLHPQENNLVHILELEPHGKLHDARTSPAETRIALRHVWCLGNEAPAARNRIANGRSWSDDPAGKRELRMIEDVEKLAAELNVEPFVNLCIFCY